MVEIRNSIRAIECLSGICIQCIVIEVAMAQDRRSHAKSTKAPWRCGKDVNVSSSLKFVLVLHLFEVEIVQESTSSKPLRSH